MITTKAMLLAAATAMFAGTAHAATLYGVDERNVLVSFDSAAPAMFLSQVQITGVTDSLQGLDFRAANGALYGLGGDRTLYSINLATGAATAIGSPLAIQGTTFGFDFNQAIDRIRIVSNTDQNYVVNPVTGALEATATPVFYASGDPNDGRNPDVTAVAYGVDPRMGGSSNQLFSIDTNNGVLARQANSAGTLTTVGPTGQLLGSRTSFDIAGNDAFAINGTTLYRVNLVTGGLTTIGNTSRGIFGLAIGPGAVPEPSTWAMMLVGFGMVGGAARYRRGGTRVTYA